MTLTYLSMNPLHGFICTILWPISRVLVQVVQDGINAAHEHPKSVLCVCVCVCLQRWRNVSFSSGFIHVQCSVDGIVYVWGRLKRRLREVLSAPGSRDGKRQEKEEPLICPVTGLGQLICWWWYCWEVKERKYKANPLSFSPQTWNPYF